MNRWLEHLLCCLYDDSLAPEHRADLAKSGLSAETIALQKIRSVPPSMIGRLLGFEAPQAVREWLRAEVRISA